MFGRRGSTETIEGAVTAKARLDRRTKNLIPRLERGEIAVIHHEDIDRVAAEHEWLGAKGRRRDRGLLVVAQHPAQHSGGPRTRTSVRNWLSSPWGLARGCKRSAISFRPPQKTI